MGESESWGDRRVSRCTCPRAPARLGIFMAQREAGGAVPEGQGEAGGEVRGVGGAAGFRGPCGSKEGCGLSFFEISHKRASD